MPTVKEWCLDTTKQLRTDIGPGASNWSAENEGSELRSLIKTAQLSIGMSGEDEMSRQVRNLVAQYVLRNEPNGKKLGQQWKSEKAMNKGRMNSGVIAAEKAFQEKVDEENV